MYITIKGTDPQKNPKAMATVLTRAFELCKTWPKKMSMDLVCEDVEVHVEMGE